MAETKDIWTSGARAFMGLEHSSQKKVLHPRLAEMVNQARPQRMLDFGCGDGRILELLHPDIGLSVYDTSPEMLRLVEQRMGQRLKGLFSVDSEIPSAEFDLVLMSMVVICLRNEKELNDAFQLIARVARPGATVIIATSHPCFRQYDFSNFHTSFGRGQRLEYLKPALPFQVTIEDSPTDSVTFTDFHWSLADTLNSIARADLSITEVMETPDDLEHPRANRTLPTFLIIKARKP